MEALKKCFNPKVIAALAVVAVGVAVFVPKMFVAALPLLLLAACPLSMIVMMAMMNKSSHGTDNSGTSSKGRE